MYIPIRDLQRTPVPLNSFRKAPDPRGRPRTWQLAMRPIFMGGNFLADFLIRTHYVYTHALYVRPSSLFYESRADEPATAALAEEAQAQDRDKQRQLSRSQDVLQIWHRRQNLEKDLGRGRNDRHNNKGVATKKRIRKQSAHHFSSSAKPYRKKRSNKKLWGTKAANLTTPGKIPTPKTIFRTERVRTKVPAHGSFSLSRLPKLSIKAQPQPDQQQQSPPSPEPPGDEPATAMAPTTPTTPKSPTSAATTTSAKAQPSSSHKIKEQGSTKSIFGSGVGSSKATEASEESESRPQQQHHRARKNSAEHFKSVVQTKVASLHALKKGIKMGRSSLNRYT